jgi:WD40 repeat protein
VYQTAQVGSREDPTTKALDLGGRSICDPAAEDDDGELQRNSRVAFSPDRSFVALLDSKGEVHLFRTATGEKVCAPLKHTRIQHDTIRAVAFCPVGETLLTRAPKSRGLWDAKTGALIDMHVSRVGVQITRFSPSGKLVLGGTNFNMAQVWDDTGRELVPVPMMHAAQVWGLAANPADTRIITASFDKTARIWDRATGRPLSAPMLHRQGVSDAVFSPDGTAALTGSWDGTARLWTVPEPVPDDEKRITAWVETMTGLKVSANVSGELLTPDEWHQSKKRLDELGGPPIVINP